MTLSPGEVEVASELMAPGADLTTDSAKAIQGRSLGQIAWRRLKKDKVSMAGGVVAILFIVIAIFAPLLSSWYGQDPNAQHYDLVDAGTGLPYGSRGGMSSTHWLGLTPTLGEDILAQLMYGARTSLITAGLATMLSLLF